MDAPDGLLPYLSVNTSLPPEMDVALGAYLQCLTDSLSSIEAQIMDLEQSLELKRQKRTSLKGQLATFSSLRSYHRRIPAEVWASIFSWALGEGIWSESERQTFTAITGVCNLWRNVARTSPNICRGLQVVIPHKKRSHPDYGTIARGLLKQEFQEDWMPWIDLASRSRHWHLELFAMDSELNLDFLFGEQGPSFTTLTVRYSWFLESITRWGVGPCTYITRVHLINNIDDHTKLADLETLFPNLEEFTVGFLLRLTNCKFPHGRVRNLRLEEMIGEVMELGPLLLGCPHLERLLLVGEIFPSGDPNLLSLVTLKSVKYLTCSEPEWLAGITLPALEAFHFPFNTFTNTSEPTLMTNGLRQFVERCKPTDLTIYMSGEIWDINYFVTLISLLPPVRQLLLDARFRAELEGHQVHIETGDLEEIICLDPMEQLRWLGAPAHGASAKSIRVSYPREHMTGQIAGERKAELAERGFDLHFIPQWKVEEMIDSVAGLCLAPMIKY